jgi:plasmid stabilization system protein ParE
MPRFRIHRLVEGEFDEAHGWYSALSPLAAENFVLCFDEALARVRLHPTAHAPWRVLFRRAKLERFPYLLLFHADRQMVSVLALVHERREPNRTLESMARRQREFR